jgi:hypothetical protein
MSTCNFDGGLVGFGTGIAKEGLVGTGIGT